jgi:ribosomal protein S18 acetylase RimI-like enzyme
MACGAFFPRGIGVGQCLVEEAVKRLATSNKISIDTFREENVAGRSARRLYERLGFQPGPLVQIEGLSRQRYTLSHLHNA